MDLLPILLLGAIVVGIVIYVMRSATPASPAIRPTVTSNSAPPSLAQEVAVEEKPATAQTESVWEVVNDAQAEVQEEYSGSVHPSSLISAEAFSGAVKRLKKAKFNHADVVAVAQSNIPAAACMGLEALCQRDDPEDASNNLLDRFDGSNSWIGYFILKYADHKALPRTTERFLSKAKEWWPANAVAVQTAQEHVRRRIACGSTTFRWQDELKDCDLEALKNVETFLKALQIEELKPLLEGIETSRISRVDTKLLESFGEFIAEPQGGKVAQHDALRQALSLATNAIERPTPRSIVIVGESGVGRSSLVELVLAKYRSMNWMVFKAGATDLLAGQVYMGELENRINQLLRNVDPVKKVVWYIPSLEELVNAGRHKYSTRSVLDIALPHLVAGKLVIVAKSAPASFRRLAQTSPRLNACIEKIELSPLDDRATIGVARRWLELQSNSGLTVSEQLLQEAQHLANQYLSDLAAPGNLIELLRRSIERKRACSEGSSVGELQLDDVISALCQQTGLPPSLLDGRAKLDLSELRQHFQSRVKGQPEAVDCLVDRVAMIKAGLTDPTRPLGVFLFVGPSGTGKTEIAKSLATFLFGSEDRMIRLDMSEYQSGNSSHKLLGGFDESDASESFASRIRKQPFSVVLLDEFEKADSSIWDLFLQVFDDGRLTDNRGLSVDCRHCLVIMTSNLGAARELSPVAGFGSQERGFDAEALRTSVSKTFRPEFVNRIDRVVVFLPLSRSSMREILHGELTKVLQRRGLRSRQWAVEWAHSAIEFLLEKGFTPDLGARPLKRAIDQYLLSPLAHAIANREVPEGDQFLLVKASEGALEVEFIDPDAPADGQPQTPPAASEEGSLPLNAIVAKPRGGAAELHTISKTLEALQERIAAEEWRTRKEALYESTSEVAFWTNPDRFATLGRIEMIDRIEAALKRSAAIALRLSRGNAQALPADLSFRLAQRLMLLSAAIDDEILGTPAEAYLRVIAADSVAGEKINLVAACHEKMATMYRSWAKARGMNLIELHPSPPHVAGQPPGECLWSVSGFACYSILEREAGLHIWEVIDSSAQTRIRFRVDVSPVPAHPTANEQARQAAAREAFRHPSETAHIVRRYTDGATTLVRDTRSNARTGCLDRVLAGNFDVIEHL